MSRGNKSYTLNYVISGTNQIRPPDFDKELRDFQLDTAIPIGIVLDQQSWVVEGGGGEWPG